jgi:cob(I)alamin adenosyltransferase
MSISTKSGDKKTSINILDSKRCELAKDDIYFHHVGEIDFLQSHLYLLMHKVDDIEIKGLINNIASKVIPKLYMSLPLAGDVKKEFNDIGELKKIEDYIEKKEKELNLKNSFYELGQTEVSSYIDIARAITRKVERTFIELTNDKKLDDEFYKLNFSYINRLSDFLFICARVVEKKENRLKVRT